MVQGQEDPHSLIYNFCQHLGQPTHRDDQAYKNCKQCQLKLPTTRIHCALCGEMYCDKCTSKFKLPAIFVNKKERDKTAPQSVCYTCRDQCLVLRKQDEENQQQQKLSSHTKANVLKSVNQDIGTLKGQPNKSPIGTNATPSLSSPQNADSNNSSKSSPINTMTAAEVHSFLNNPLNPSLSLGDVKEIQPPIVWLEKFNFRSCPKCNNKDKSNIHNCRVCGLLYCEKCTSKMDLPACFEKKHKKGPARVCDDCRHKILIGWKLTDKPTFAQQTTSIILGAQSGIQNTSGGTVNANTMISASQTQKGAPNSSGKNSSLQSIFGATKSPQDASATDGLSITISFEGQSQIICRIPIQSTSVSLSEIDILFKKQCPQSQPYNYYFKSEVVPENFHDIFTIDKLGKSLVIKHKIHSNNLLSAPAIQMTSANGKNPFQRKNKSEAKTTINKPKRKFQKPNPEAFKPHQLSDEIKSILSKTDQSKQPPQMTQLINLNLNGVAQQQHLNQQSKSSNNNSPRDRIGPPPNPNAQVSSLVAALTQIKQGEHPDSIFKQRAKLAFGSK